MGVFSPGRSSRLQDHVCRRHDYRVERQVDLLDWYIIIISSQSSVPESFASFKNLLLTGSPGCGKTTVLKLVLDRLGDLRLAGFLTLEIREHGQRVGFEAIGLNGHRAILAHVRYRSLVSVGRYGVELDRLVPLIEEEMVRPLETVDAYLIDEIGKMECHCQKFTEAVSRLLEGPVPLVATIALRGGGFIADVKKRPNVQIVEVTNGNRQTLPEQITAWVKQNANQANTP